MTFSAQIVQLAMLVGLVTSPNVFASNGDHSSAASAPASGMGGTAMGNYTTETEALFRNPALLSLKTKEVMKPRFELTLAFAKHNSQGESTNAGLGVGSGNLTGSYSPSKDSVQILPNIAAGMRITEDLSAGFGIIALGGSTVDYTGVTSLSEQKSEQLMYRLTPAVSYRIIPELSVGAGLVVGFSQLALNGAPATGGAQSTRSKKSAWGLGGIFGASYAPVEGLRFGAAYVTKTKFGYDELYDLSSLSSIAGPTGKLNHVDFQEPSEFSVGVAYEINDVVVAFDYRLINWSSAMGYSDLGWKDQSVFGVGAQYKLHEWAFRVGANYGKSPIRSSSGVNGDDAQTFQGVAVTKGGVDVANVTGFTAITEWEIDGGASYKFSENLSADLALVYLPTNTVSTTGNFAGLGGNYGASTKANEWAILAGVNYQL